MCRGDGRLPIRTIRVTNIRREGIQRLSRSEAQQLQRVFRLGQEVAATRIDLRKDGRRVTFVLRRETQQLLDGDLSAAS